MLVPQPLEDPSGRVPLLAVDLSITLEDLLDDWQERLQLRGPPLREPVTRWLGVRQDLLQRVPVNVIFLARRPLADLTVQDAAADLNPLSRLTGRATQPACR